MLILMCLILWGIFDWTDLKPSKFGDFIKNPKTEELLKKFENGFIKPIVELQRQLELIGLKIPIATLKRYLKQIKVTFYYCC